MNMAGTSIEKKDFYQIRFDSIQALRGTAALFVVLEHIRFLNCGAFGVDIFFCISGFMMMLSTHKDTTHFLIRRLIRVVPLYYIMTLGTFALLLVFPDMFAQTKADPVFLVKSLLFIPFDIGDGALQPLMRIGWTLNCEVFFYLLFFIALHISHKYRGLICSGLILAPVAAAWITGTNFAPLSFYGNPVMLEFILGILIYYAARGIYGLFSHDMLPKICMPIGLLTASSFFILLMASKPFLNVYGFRRPLFWGLPAAVIVLCFFTAGLFLKMPKALVHLGNISFSLYFMHYYPIMLLDRKIFDFGSPDAFSFLGVVLGIAVSVILALLCHSLIEKRFTKQLLTAANL